MSEALPPTLKPLAPDQWDLQKARHLLDRAAFGGSRSQARELMFMGKTKAVTTMVSGYLPTPPEAGEVAGPEVPLQADPLPAQSPSSGSDGETTPNPRELRRRQAAERERRLFSIQLPWLRRMHSAAAPREKLTLFWHGMVTSGFTKVDNRPLMLAQNARLRSLATGDYRLLIAELAVDPAMISYLDIDQNRRAKPNENFARELLELFTLGEGNYTDADIKKLARVFVNLKLDPPDDDQALSADNLPSIEKSAGFSDRMKRIRYEIGSIFRKPVCGELLCRRLLKFYLTDDPEPALVKDLAAVLRANSWEVGPTLEVLFSSQTFYDQPYRGLQIKSPVQLLIQGLTDMGIAEVPVEPARFAMQELGQSLFNPPNVAGWPAGRTWINASSIAKRYQLLEQLVDLALAQSDSPLKQDLEALPLMPEQVIENLVEQWFPHALPLAKQRLIKHHAETFKTQPKQLLLALSRSPEYQLC